MRFYCTREYTWFLLYCSLLFPRILSTPLMALKKRVSSRSKIPMRSPLIPLAASRV